MLTTHAQFASLFTRAALPENDPRHISREMLQVLLEGRVQLPQPLPEGELPPNHYRLTTTGVLPPFGRLNGELFASANDLYSGRYDWKPHEMVADEDVVPGEHVIFLKVFGVRTTSEMAILWGKEHGYRPTNHVENAEFGMAYPELQRKQPIVALGSFAVRAYDRYASVLLGDADRRNLGDVDVDFVLAPLCAVSFVRK